MRELSDFDFGNNLCASTVKRWKAVVEIESFRCSRVLRRIISLLSECLPVPLTEFSILTYTDRESTWVQPSSPPDHFLPRNSQHLQFPPLSLPLSPFPSLFSLSSSLCTVYPSSPAFPFANPNHSHLFLDRNLFQNLTNPIHVCQFSQILDLTTCRRRRRFCERGSRRSSKVCSWSPSRGYRYRWVIWIWGESIRRRWSWT